MKILFLSIFCFLFFMANLIAQNKGEENSQTEEIFLEEMPVSTTPVPKAETTDRVYTWVRQAPQFPGIGMPRMIRFIQDNKQYPVEAARKGIEGTVIVTFVVEKDGSFTDMKIEKSVGSGCDEEALRIVKAMPKWQPGRTARNEVVRVKYTLPIEFKLD